MSRIEGPARRPIRRLIGALLVLLVATSLAGCSNDDAIGTAAPPPAPTDERRVFVALGGDETLARGVDDSFRVAWTRQAFAALPRSAVHVNLATEDATVGTGLGLQLGPALELDPTVATVWFGNGDAREGTDPDDFAAQLTDLVTPLRDAGAQVILIANEGDDSIASYRPRIADVADATGATYVAVPGPVGRPSDPSVQDAIADAVIARLSP